MDKIQIHKKLCDQLNETYQKKNSDYGDSFGKSFRKRGITAAMVRMEDKWNRLDNLTLYPENILVNDESIGDTLLDLANYCLMTYMELNPGLFKTVVEAKDTSGNLIKTLVMDPCCSTVTDWKDLEGIDITNSSIIDYATSTHCDREYE